MNYESTYKINQQIKTVTSESESPQTNTLQKRKKSKQNDDLN